MPSRLDEWFSRRVGFPLIIYVWWRRPAIRRQFRRLLRENLESQYWPPEQQAAWQLEQVRALLAHAGAHVPYYRDLFRQLGFDPRGIQRLDDLQALPLINRQVIQAEGRRMLAENLAPGEIGTSVTSGTSGAPMQFAFDPGFYVHNEAAAWMSDMAAGRRFGSRMAYIWGAPYNQTNYRGWRGLARRWLRNEFHFDSHVLWDARFHAYHQRLKALSPALLVGFASSVTHLARYLERQGLTGAPGYPRVALIPSGEVLEPDMRATLERVFQAPVFNRYGSSEVGLIAYECERHAGLHLNIANIYVENAGGDAGGEPRELVVTQLRNYAMPMIRYQIGDLAVHEPQACTCGRTTPMLRRMAGRTAASFVTARGTVVEGYYVINPVALLPGVIDFQVIQEEVQALRLLLVTGPQFRLESLAKIHERVQTLIGDGTRLAVEQVDAIPRPPSGKTQIAISKVKLGAGGLPGALERPIA